MSSRSASKLTCVAGKRALAAKNAGRPQQKETRRAPTEKTQNAPHIHRKTRNAHPGHLQAAHPQQKEQMRRALEKQKRPGASTAKKKRARGPPARTSTSPCGPRHPQQKRNAPCTRRKKTPVCTGLNSKWGSGLGFRALGLKVFCLVGVAVSLYACLSQLALGLGFTALGYGKQYRPKVLSGCSSEAMTSVLESLDSDPYCRTQKLETVKSRWKGPPLIC